MAVKGYRMTGQDGWWISFSTAGSEQCSASSKVVDEETISWISKTVRNMTIQGVVGAVVLTGLAVAAHSIPT